MPALVLTLLGGFSATDASGRPVHVRAHKARALLSYLALLAKPCSRAKLSDLLWGDVSADEQARRSLRQALTGLRRAVPDGLISADRDVVRLDMSRVEVDVLMFKEALARGDERALDHAATLYRGDFLDGFSARADAFDTWAEDRRRELRRDALDAMQGLCAARHAAGDFDSATRIAMRLVAFDPLRELAHRELMKALANCGRRVEALRQYEECRRILARNLGVQPSAETTRLAASIATADPPSQGADGTTGLELRQACVVHVCLLAASPEAAAVARDLERTGALVLRRSEAEVLCVYGVVRGQHGDPETAVTAALGVRDQARRQGFDASIGIASGQLLVDATVDPHRIHGDPLRAAVVVHGQRPGISVTNAVYHALSPRLRARRIDDHESTTRIVESLAPRSRPEARALVGREFELAQIEAAFDVCARTGCGRVVVVCGEAGIGKTRLMYEALGMATARRWGTAVQAFDDLEFPRSQAPLAPLVWSGLGIASQTVPEERAAILDRAVGSGLVRAEDRHVVDSMLRPHLFGGGPPDRDAAAFARRRKQAVTQLIVARARSSPLVLWLEDVDRADAAAADQVSELIAAVRALPVIVFMTFRGTSAEVSRLRVSLGRSAVTTFELGPLRPDEASRLVAALGCDRVDAIARRGGGNPLFLTELARSLPGGDSVPASISSLVQARMDVLSPEARWTAQCAALLGDRIDVDALETLCGGTGDVRALEAVRILEGDAEGYRFAHAIVREAIYRSIVDSRRLELHRRAAGHFAARDPVLHATHLDRGGSDDAAAAYARAALAQSTSGEPSRALALCERGLELGCDAAQRFELLHQRAGLLRALGRARESMDAWASALEAASSSQQQCRARLGAAASQRAVDRQHEALAMIQQAEALVRDSDDHALLAEIEYQRGSVLFPLGDHDASLQAHTTSLRHARQAGDRRAEARALSGIADAHYAQGRLAAARRCFVEAEKLAADVGVLDLQLSSEGMLAFMGVFDNRLHDAATQCSRLAKRAGAIGALHGECFMRTGACYALALSGAWEELVDAAERACALAHAIDARRFEALSRAYLAIGRARQRRFDAAAALLEAARRLADASGIAFSGGVVQAAALATERDSSARLALLRETAAVLGPAPLQHSWLFCAHASLEVAVTARSPEHVRACADEIETRASIEACPLSDTLAETAEVAWAMLESPDAGQEQRTTELAARLARIGLRPLARALQDLRPRGP